MHWVTFAHVYNNNNCLYVYWHIILVRVRTCDYVIVLRIIISAVPRDEVRPPPPAASSRSSSSLPHMTIEHVVLLQLRSIDNNNIRLRVFTTLVRQYTIDTHKFSYSLIPIKVYTRVYIPISHIFSHPRERLSECPNVFIYIIYYI